MEKGAGATGVASGRRPRLRHQRLQLLCLFRRRCRFAMLELLRPTPGHKRLAASASLTPFFLLRLPLFLLVEQSQAADGDLVMDLDISSL